MRLSHSLTPLVLVFLTFTAPTGTQDALHFNLLVHGGRVLNGTSDLWLRTDIGALTGHIAALGHLDMHRFSMSEIDVGKYAAQPWVATTSDRGIGWPGDGPVYPRHHGTSLRKIHHQHATGIDHVLVNGEFVVEEGGRPAA